MRSRMLIYAWRAAGESWSRVVEEQPDEPVAHYGRAVLHWLAGDLESARSEWMAAVARGLETTGPSNFDQLLRVP